MHLPSTCLLPLTPLSSPPPAALQPPHKLAAQGAAPSLRPPAEQVVINGAAPRTRFHLTKRSTMTDVEQRWGVLLSVRGRYYPPGAPGRALSAPFRAAPRAAWLALAALPGSSAPVPVFVAAEPGSVAVAVRGGGAEEAQGGSWGVADQANSPAT